VYRAASRASATTAPREPPVPLQTLQADMTPIQRLFFTKLDRELDKVERFYHAREREFRALDEKLRHQLTELAEHRVEYNVRPASLCPLIARG
jgi:hypothetical protein